MLLPTSKARSAKGKTMATVTIKEAQAKLPDLIHALTPGEEVVITENNQPVAKLVIEKTAVRQRPEPGLGKGLITIVAADDEHLRDFAEYMP
jgi:antitoxin (DNA-binding transcriptional repressor) of toxin-antitoxin stability system